MREHAPIGTFRHARHEKPKGGARGPIHTLSHIWHTSYRSPHLRIPTYIGMPKYRVISNICARILRHLAVPTISENCYAPRQRKNTLPAGSAPHTAALSEATREQADMAETKELVEPVNGGKASEFHVGRARNDIQLLFTSQVDELHGIA